MATTALDLITGALRFINSYTSGEVLDAADTSDALSTLNDLLESLSTTESAIYATNEVTYTLTANTERYTIGNYAAGTFAGVVTSGSAVITGVIVPSDMVANGDLSGTGIPAGTTVLSFNAGAGTVTMSANATATPGAQQISYTIPGAIKVDRPLRITDAFTRISTSGGLGLDYPIEIIDQNKYTNIGYKKQPAPWPTMLWYNPTFPLGTIYLYQMPSQAAELHLFNDLLLTTFSSLTQQVSLPQGYTRMLKRMLARELWPEYPTSEWSPVHEKLVKEAMDAVKALNASPVRVSTYEAALLNSNHTDAGWIYNGGFN